MKRLCMQCNEFLTCLTDATPPPDYGNLEPPNYNTVEDPPPSYESIFGEIRQARQQSSGILDFLKKTIMIFLSTVGCTFCLAFLLAIPIACIVIGAKYKDDCRVQPKIPLYLIVLGSFGILRNIVGLCNQIKRRNSSGNNDDEDKKKSAFEGIIDCFMIGWFIAGNVWIYSNYPPDYDNTDSIDYCNKTLYLFAFGLTTASYAFVGFVCFCMCCIGCCSLLMD
ncbi:transmembrane protein 272 isoform X2 [Hydra vulgaris]|uniref:Transmembrane protein 272 isoform X2 n=1 Tax=Hydra vulgaris TaxID=6087 RepID=A0ABM4D2Y7_HYDVU